MIDELEDLAYLGYLDTGEDLQELVDAAYAAATGRK